MQVTLSPRRKSGSPNSERLLNTPDGKGGTEQKSLGKRVEAATGEIFGESISNNNVAIKYSELLQAASEPTKERSAN